RTSIASSLVVPDAPASRCSRRNCRASSCAALTPANPPPRTTIRFVTAARFSFASAEGEAIRLRSLIKELDLEQAIVDPPRLADQLVGALLAHGPIAVAVQVAPMGDARRPTIDEDAERDRGSVRSRPHDEVQIAGMELEGDP